MNLAPVEAIAKAVLYEGYISLSVPGLECEEPAALDLRRRVSARYARRTKPIPAKFRPNVWFRAASRRKSRFTCDFCIWCGERSGNFASP